MKKQPLAPKDRVYRLRGNKTPLSVIIPTRHTRRYPLLYFDEETNQNRPLRYAINQKSPFEDEQDGNAIVEPIVFEDGMLMVPKNNPVLQAFLYYHPLNGKLFEEVDREQDAAKELEAMELEVDALSEARKMQVDQLEVMARVLFGYNVEKMTTAELRRDIIVFAKNNPREFIATLGDSSLKYNATVRTFFDRGLLAFRNNNKEVWFNTKSNKKKMLSVPYGEDPYQMAADFLQSDEGLDALKALEMYLETAE